MVDRRQLTMGCLALVLATGGSLVCIPTASATWQVPAGEPSWQSWFTPGGHVVRVTDGAIEVFDPNAYQPLSVWHPGPAGLANDRALALRAPIQRNPSDRWIVAEVCASARCWTGDVHHPVILDLEAGTSTPITGLDADAWLDEVAFQDGVGFAVATSAPGSFGPGPVIPDQVHGIDLATGKVLWSLDTTVWKQQQTVYWHEDQRQLTPLSDGRVAFHNMATNRVYLMDKDGRMQEEPLADQAYVLVRDAEHKRIYTLGWLEGPGERVLAYNDAFDLVGVVATVGRGFGLAVADHGTKLVMSDDDGLVVFDVDPTSPILPGVMPPTPAPQHTLPFEVDARGVLVGAAQAPFVVVRGDRSNNILARVSLADGAITHRWRAEATMVIDAELFTAVDAQAPAVVDQSGWDTWRFTDGNNAANDIVKPNDTWDCLPDFVNQPMDRPLSLALPVPADARVVVDRHWYKDEPGGRTAPPDLPAVAWREVPVVGGNVTLQPPIGERGIEEFVTFTAYETNGTVIVRTCRIYWIGSDLDSRGAAGLAPAIVCVSLAAAVLLARRFRP